MKINFGQKQELIDFVENDHISLFDLNDFLHMGILKIQFDGIIKYKLTTLGQLIYESAKS